MAVIHSFHWEEIWPHARDCMRPTTPYAAEQLEKCRTYSPPSKAHVKRLLKLRPQVFCVQPQEPKEPCPKVLDHNRLQTLATASKRLLKRDAVRDLYPRVCKPEAPARLRSEWLTLTPPASDTDEWDLEAIEARIARLQAEQEQAKRDAERVRHA